MLLQLDTSDPPRVASSGRSRTSRNHCCDNEEREYTSPVLVELHLLLVISYRTDTGDQETDDPHNRQRGDPLLFRYCSTEKGERGFVPKHAGHQIVCCNHSKHYANINIL